MSFPRGREDEKVNLAVAAKTLRDVILERKKSGDLKDVILGVHRLNQVLAKAKTYAQAEELCMDLCCKGKAKGEERRGTVGTDGKQQEHIGDGSEGERFLQMLVDVVVTGAPDSYPVLCLLYTLSMFRDTSSALVRLHIPLILSALMKGRIEEATADMAKKILETIHKQKNS